MKLLGAFSNYRRPCVGFNWRTLSYWRRGRK